VGAGAVGLASGAYFGARWLDDRARSDPRCAGNHCDPTGTELRNDARNVGPVAVVAAGSGAAAMILGTVLVATAPGLRLVEPQTAVRQRLEVSPVVGAGVGGLRLQGAW
jgi:hypothetical protein